MAGIVPPSDGPEPRPWDTPESHQWLEDLLDCVWRAEADWRFNDRLDMAIKIKKDRRRE